MTFLNFVAWVKLSKEIHDIYYTSCTDSRLQVDFKSTAFDIMSIDVRTKVKYHMCNSNNNSMHHKTCHIFILQHVEALATN